MANSGNICLRSFISADNCWISLGKVHGSWPETGSVGQRWENPRRSYEASGNGMILDSRARQLPDESVVMRYPTREYQINRR